MMAATQWDCVGRRDVEVGARRWAVEWSVYVSEDAAREAAEGLEEHHYETHSRNFPTAALAVAFARRLDVPLLMWCARVQEQVFEADGNGPGYGWWEGVGEWEEVDDR